MAASAKYPGRLRSVASIQKTKAQTQNASMSTSHMTVVAETRKTGVKSARGCREQRTLGEMIRETMGSENDGDRGQ